MIFARVNAPQAREMQALVKARCVASGGHAVVIHGTDKASVLASFAKELHFPDYFGKNLDALADSLGDWQDGQSTPVSVLVQAPGDFWASPSGGAVRDILASVRNPAVTVVAVEAS